MGSRGRSIRLRIYFLVAIPLVAMVGLLAYVAGTSVNNAINLDRAPDLINATSLPTAEFVRLVQDERAAAVVYLFQPTAGQPGGVRRGRQGDRRRRAGVPGGDELAGHQGQRDPRRGEGHQHPHRGDGPDADAPRPPSPNRAVTPLQALGGYSAGIQNELKLFLAEADSLTNATAAAQALGLIATVSAREALSQEYALLSGVLAGNRMTRPTARPSPRWPRRGRATWWTRTPCWIRPAGASTTRR